MPGTAVDGLLIIDKPVGPTSHDVVARMRQVLGERRIGHTGTLDPGASGVLPLVLGRATRLAQFLSAADKTYEATIRLGVDTDTYDSLGRAVGTAYAGVLPSRSDIDGALNEFRGAFLQRPPAYSAKRVDGRRSYKAARAGTRGTNGSPLAPAPVPVSAHAIELVEVDFDRVTLRLQCSAGFYVRSLAHDLGERLGTGAHLLQLRRTRSGTARIDEAVALAAVERDPDAAVRALVPLPRMLPQFRAVVLTDEGVRRAAHGRDLGPAELEAPATLGPGEATVRLLDRRGDLVGLAEPARTRGLLHPRVVLV
jgi:tRNA pseudouridine55 synthase